MNTRLLIDDYIGLDTTVDIRTDWIALESRVHVTDRLQGYYREFGSISYEYAMKVIGIEFAASDMNYVIVETRAAGKIAVQATNRLTLADTRSPNALRAFQQAVRTLLSDSSPDRVAIKAKPEKGAMAAGPAALKMEALVLTALSCDVQFISGARINRCADPEKPLKAYHVPAFKAAACACNDDK